MIEYEILFLQADQAKTILNDYWAPKGWQVVAMTSGVSNNQLVLIFTLKRDR